MKKTVSVLLIIAMMLAAVLAIMSINATEDVAPEPEKPEGTPINSMSDYMAHLITNEETEGKVYYLNIDVYEAPLADFKGTLYGNGHTFSCSIDAFSNISGATIKDLNIVFNGTSTVFGNLSGVTLENVTIKMKKGTVANSVTDSVIKNVSVTVSEAESSIFGSSISGSTLEGVTATVNGEKAITKSLDFGGFATTIENSSLKDVVCNYPIKISGFKAFVGIIGGIASQVNGEVSFNNVKHEGNIFLNTWATTDDGISEKISIGGIVGKTKEKSSIEFRDCENTGSVLSTQTGANLGGILGFSNNANVTMVNCKNSGEIMGCSDTSSLHVGLGGMIGWTSNVSVVEYNIILSNCENTGKVYDTPADMIFNAFCQISAIEQNNANKNVEDYEPVDAAGFKDQYLEEYIAEFFSKAENSGKDDSAAIAECLGQSKFRSSNHIYAGGIMGRVFAVSDVYVNGCKNFADVIIAGSAGNWGGAGGIAGSFVTVGNWEGIAKADLRFVNCYNEGKIRGGQPAGIIGGKFMQFTSSESTLIVEYCVNNGEIIGREGGRAAGIVCDFDSQGGENSCHLTAVTLKNCANYGNVSGATISGGIVSSMCNDASYPKAMNISNCYNHGNISTINDMTTVKNEKTEEEEIVVKEEAVSGGIVAITAIPSTITNCVNDGTVTAETEKNAFPIVSDAANVSATSNVHVGEAKFEYSAGKTSAEVTAIVEKMNFVRKSNTASLEANIEVAEKLVEIDYSAETWAEFSEAFSAAKIVVKSATVSQKDLDAIEDRLVNAMEALDQKPADFTELDAMISEGMSKNRDDWDDYSYLNLTNAIIAAVEAKNTENVLQSVIDDVTLKITYAINNLEERGEVFTLETVVDLTVGGLHDTKPAQTQAPATEGAETEGEDVTEPVEQGGCGGIIGGAAVVLVAVAAVGVGLSFKKKED